MAPTSAPLRRVRPFPFDRLDRLALSQVDAARALLCHLPLPTPERPAIEALLGGPIAIRLADAYAVPARELLFRLPGPPVPVLARIAAGAGRSVLLAINEWRYEVPRREGAPVITRVVQEAAA